MLTQARARAFGQCGLDADHAIKACEDVDPGDADLLRLALRRAGKIHDAAHALNQEIIAGLAGAGAVLTKAGDRGIDQTRVELRQAFLFLFFTKWGNRTVIPTY